MRTILFVLLAVTLVGCGDHGPATSPIIDFPRPAPGPGLDAPAEALIGGVTLRLDAYVWRDFMPVSPPDGYPLSALLLLTTADASPFPAGVHVLRVWVLHGGSYWTTRKLAESPRGGPDTPSLTTTARGGPRWEPGSTVDVVVQIEDGAGRRPYLRALEVLIGPTR